MFLVIFMVTMYVIRHCEAEGNSLKIYQGHTDLDVTEAGERQLEKLGDRFDSIHIDKVYSSPLKRARKTAAAVADRKGLPITDNVGLIELHGGDFEGMKFTTIFSDYAEYEEIWLKRPQEFCAPNGESMRVLYERIWGAVKEIAAENSGKTLVVASHGAAVRNLLCRVLFGDVEKLNETPWSENTAVTKLVFDDELNATIEFMNDVSHLPEDYLPKNSRMDTMMEAEK